MASSVGGVGPNSRDSVRAPRLVRPNPDRGAAGRARGRIRGCRRARPALARLRRRQQRARRSPVRVEHPHPVGIRRDGRLSTSPCSDRHATGVDCGRTRRRGVGCDGWRHVPPRSRGDWVEGRSRVLTAWPILGETAASIAYVNAARCQWFGPAARGADEHVPECSATRTRSASRTSPGDPAAAGRANHRQARPHKVERPDWRARRLLPSVVRQPRSTTPAPQSSR